MMRITLFFVSIFLIYAPACAQQRPASLQAIWQQGQPYITTYSHREYKADIQIWSIAQTDNGMIYAAVTDGVLEYDGTSWRLIRTPLTNPVKSMAKDNHGRVYAGGVDELGYLEIDPAQGTRFHSLLPELGTAATHFGDVWFTITTQDTAYFVSDHHIMRWANGRFKVWGEDTPLKMGWVWEARNRMYVDTPDRGLMRFEGDSLVRMPGGEEFRGKNIRTLLPYGKKDLLAIGDAGSFIYDGRHVIPLPGGVDAERPAERVYHSIPLARGGYALATTGAGVYLLDERGVITNHYTRKEGLTSNLLNAVFEDREGDLWLATNNGINRIELNSPVRLLNEIHGLEEHVSDLAVFNNTLYVATPNGMFLLSNHVRNAKTAQPPAFKRVDLDIFAWECKVIGNNLVVSTYNGLFCLDANNGVSIIQKNLVLPIAESPAAEPDHFFFGTTENYVSEAFKKNNSWTTGDARIQLDDRPNEIIRKNDGNVLINTRSGILYEIAWTEKKKTHTLSDPHKLIRYDSASGLPAHDNDWLTVADTAIYMMDFIKGVFRFNPNNKMFRPDSVIMRSMPNTSITWGPLMPALGGGCWFTAYAQNQIHLFKYDGHMVNEWNAAARITDLTFERILDEDKNIMAITSSDLGVILYNKTTPFNSRPLFKTALRKVLIDKDSAIYTGYGGEHTAEIPYSSNDIRFQFALPSYDLSAQNQYQYMLEGFDQTWSPWSTESQANFTNLSEGNYTFRVRGKNIYGQSSDEATYTFTILPPWYRTWWAYGLYVIALAALIIELVNWRIRNLKKEKIQLENVIHERTKEISQQTEKLKEMDLVKSRFFANISHEFRTPLSLILAPIQDKLKAKDLPAAERASTLLVRRNANRLLTLVNQLLDLSKLENGKMVLHIQQGNLEQVLRVVTSSYDSLAENKKIAFVKDIALALPDTWYDADKLEKIVNNVLFNAFKFTPAGGTVTFTAKAQPATGKLDIEIKDTGKGIPENEQQHIFSPFYQSSLTDDGSGTGLGLSLVHELVTLHGGQLRLQSTLHQGTTIGITIPCTREAFPAGTLVSHAQPDLEEAVQTPDEVMDEDEWKSDDPEEADADALQADSVLIIEDNTDLRDYIAAALSDRFRTFMARDGKEGLELAVTHTPNLIISDVMMPGMTGVALTAKIKADVRTSHIPVILLTAKSDQDSRMEGFSAGADDYIAKPFYTEELRLRAANLIEQRKKLAALFMTGVTVAAPEPQVVRGPSLDEKFVQKVKEITEANISNFDFSVEKMADEVHLSRSQLFRKLKSVTGLTPTEFINDMRLNKAAELILTNTDKLSHIGYAVGFKEPSYFSKSFRKKFGVNPSEYATKA